MSDRQPGSAPTLARTMGLGALVIYGVGDMLGSGVYALMGRAAEQMGSAIWLAFVTSMVAALLTGLSYASLGSRYPRAAGAAYITQRAYGFAFLSYMVGLAVLASGITSMATQSRAFTGYVDRLAGETPDWLVICCFIAALTIVNFWGMRESTWLNLVCTTIEVTGIAIVIVVGLRYWGTVNYLEVPAPASGAAAALTLPLVLQGAALTFFSFIGFEDMLNVVEEVKDPRRNFPRAVMLSLLAVTVIYVAAAISAVSVVPHGELAASKEPLVEVVRRGAPAFPPLLFSGISLFAITNTALLNYIMGSRLAYGMARQGLLPATLGAVHPIRRTPHVAIACLMVIALALALSVDLSDLARATSSLLLSVFVLINAALIVLQRRQSEPKGQFEVPTFVPLAGILVCAALLLNQPPQALRIAGILLAGIALLYLVLRPRGITEETLADLDD
jgi:amino acid transporter